MFKDIMSQTTKGVTAPTDTPSGGVNAQQIGLGVSVGSIDTMHLAGSPMTTNNPTDLRINGDGFFLVRLSDAQEVPYLTRAGDFHVDAARNLVTSDGLFVLDNGGANITLEDDVVSFTIGQDGVINQTMADGTTQAGAQLGIGKVVNLPGLEKIGGNLYRMTANANPDGVLDPLTANSAEDSTGAIIAGQLEMSMLI